MTASFDFDRLLTSVLRDEGPEDVSPSIVEAALTRANAVRQRRPLVRALDRRAWPARSWGRLTVLADLRLVTVILAALVILAVAVALIGAIRLLERNRDVFGEFHRTGELPPASQGNRYIDAAASLHDGRVLIVGMYDTSGPADAWAYLYDPAGGTWAETGHEPTYRGRSTATTLEDGRVLIVGGWLTDAEGLPVLPAAGELYDPTTGTFELTRGELATPRYDHTATLLTDGRVLITGGSGADFNAARPEMASAEIFDPQSGMFSPTGSMSEPRELHVATRLADGRVLITGGMTSREASATSTAEIYDPATGSFTPVGRMSVARSRHAAVALIDGRVLVVGGGARAVDRPDWEPLAAAELFDPTSGSFTTTASLATERIGPSATLLTNGRVLVAGGSNDFGAPRTAELFDPVTGRFDAAGASAGPHGDAWTGVLPDGRVLLLGQIDDPASNGVPELWSEADPAVASASTPSSISGRGFTAMDTSTDVLRAGHTATRLADGRVLLTGGEDASKPQAGAVASAEILDPTTGRSTAVGDMSTPRSGHVAVLLTDGRVMVAGGEPEDCPPPSGSCVWPSPSAEIFDPGTGRFTRIAADLGPAQSNSRGGMPAAILLADGRVLWVGTAVGASSISDWTHRSVAVIDPVTGASEPAPKVPCTANLALALLPDGRVFVDCGGRTPGAYEYDAAARTITAIPGNADWDAAVALGDGRVLLVRETGEAAVFDPTTEAFSPTGSMPTQDDPDPGNRYADPYRRRLTLLDDGRVLVSGGRSVDTPMAALATAELYDPATGTFRAIGPMQASRYQHTATLLDDGRVVLVGGVSRSPDRTDPQPAEVEIFDATALP